MEPFTQDRKEFPFPKDHPPSLATPDQISFGFGNSFICCILQPIRVFLNRFGLSVQAVQTLPEAQRAAGLTPKLEFPSWLVNLPKIWAMPEEEKNSVRRSLTFTFTFTFTYSFGFSFTAYSRQSFY